MLSRKSFVISFLFMLCASVGYAQTPSSAPKHETGFLKRSVTLGSSTMNYRVYIPGGYDPAKKYPVVLFLHGAGSTGSDNEKQIGGPQLGSVIQLFGAKYPEAMVLLSPSFRKLKTFGWVIRQSKLLKRLTKPSRNLTAMQTEFI